LYAKHLGQPIIVVGGGPSAPSQLAAVLATLDGDPVYIFANDHGFKLGLTPDYIMCKDEHHSETKQRMEPILRAYGAYPIVARHEWADIVMRDWKTQGNGGQMGIGLAALMGGKPIIPVGFDCYQAEGTYFHDKTTPNVSGGRKHGHWQGSMSRLRFRLEGAVIRAPAGFMRSVFYAYDPREELPEPVIPAVFEPYRLLTQS
jgi:hypothetical protein